MKTNLIKLVLFVFTLNLGAQQNNIKLSKHIKVTKDVTIDLNTSYVQLEIDTWNKDELEIEAFVDDKKLSGDALKNALEHWKLKVEGSGDYVKISSEGAQGTWSSLNDLNINLESLNLDLETISNLSDFEFGFSEMPEMPELPELPEMVHMDVPEVPELPELPELPEGVHTISFDAEAYKAKGEPYLEAWSKDFESKYGKVYKEKMKTWARKMAKVDFKGYEKRMEVWGEKFGQQFGEDYEKKMNAWGEEFSKRFDGEWAKEMEAWGEKYGKQMEERAKQMEARTKSLEARERAIHQRQSMVNDQKANSKQHSEDGIKRVIKIKMPKKAKLKMNVRHGELKLSSVIHNLKADLSHTGLTANHINGMSTSINVAYSPVHIDLWSQGELNLKFVQQAYISNSEQLMLNSNSSNITIDNLSHNAIINGSFGDLVISKISDDFSNLNIVLENSDAVITLPKTDYNVYFKGNRSKLNNETTTQKTIEKTSSGVRSAKSIVLNTKFSDVTLKD